MRHSYYSLVLDSCTVFCTLYCLFVLCGVHSLEKLNYSIPVATITSQVELEFISYFALVVVLGKSTADYQRNQILVISHELGRIHSDKLCLFYLVRSA